MRPKPAPQGFRSFAATQCALSHLVRHLSEDGHAASSYHCVTPWIRQVGPMPYPYNLAVAAGLMIVVLTCSLALALT